MNLMDYSSVGNVRGHFSNPDNRAAKLLAEWKNLSAKFERMVVDGKGKTETARLAYAALLIMETGIRVGNEESAKGRECINKHSPHCGKQVQTFGVTTLLNKHVKKSGTELTLQFVGKKAVEQSLTTNNPIFLQFAPSGDSELSWLEIDYPLLFRFLKRYVGRQFTPKDLRRAKVNQVFLSLLAGAKDPNKKAVRELIAQTAEIIGHTKGVCKRSYLSSVLIDDLFNPPG